MSRLYRTFTNLVLDSFWPNVVSWRHYVWYVLAVMSRWAGFETFLTGLLLVFIRRTDWLVVVRPDEQLLYPLPTIVFIRGVDWLVTEAWWVGYPTSTLFIRGLTCHQEAWCVTRGGGWLVTEKPDGSVLVLLASTMLSGGRLSCYRGLMSRSLTFYLFWLNLQFWHLGVRILWAVMRRFRDFLTGLLLVFTRRTDWLVVVRPDEQLLYPLPTIVFIRGWTGLSPRSDE